MNWSLFQCAITLAFFGLACKLIDMRTKSKTGWKTNVLGALLILVLFMSGTSIDRGWPSYSGLPSEFVFIHAVVQEPKNNEAGRIVLLIRTEYQPNMPYSVMIPYDDTQALIWRMATMKANTDGEIPVSYDPDEGYQFHIEDDTDAEKSKTKSIVIDPPKFRSA